MRRVFFLVLIALFASSFAISASAQRTSFQGPKKGQQLAKSAETTRFANIVAYSDGSGVWVSWQMDVEVGNLGFNVYRSNGRTSELLTTTKFVAGAAAMSSRTEPEYGGTYGFYDSPGNYRSRYFVEALGSNGARLLTDMVYPQYVMDLSNATGISRDEMRVRGNSNPTSLQQTNLDYPKDLSQEVDSFRQSADQSTHRMVISQPGVARIGIKKDGFYRVPRAQLEAAGFNVNSDSTTWQLFAEGVEQAIIVGAGGTYIEFYGTGVDKRETDVRRYYLISGVATGKRIQARTARANVSTVVTPNYAQTFSKTEKVFYIETILNGEAENYFGRAITSSTTSPAMTFDLSGVDFSVPTTNIQFRFQGFSDTPHVFEITFNGEVLPATATGTSLENFSIGFTLPTTKLIEGTNSVKFRAIGPTGDIGFFDKMDISFNRKFLADQNKVSFYTPNYRIAKLGGFTSPNVRVFDMTHDGDPVLMTNLVFQQNGATFGTDLPAARGRSFFAVEDSAILAPESVTANNPELLGVPTNAFNTVVIAYKDFLTQAETWAQYRRAQGYTVKVIEVTELYDEFNYGQLSADAIKSFLAYAYTNWATPPRYVLLMGDASWDSRNYEGFGFFNFVPSKMVPMVYTETVSDEALADVDNDGLAEMAIGRFPARTVAEVNNAFTKTVNWETQLTSSSLMSRGALFAYDDNVGFDFALMSGILRDQLPAGTPAAMVYRNQPDANNTLITEMNTGKFIVNYSGHGTAGSWGGNPVFFNVNSVALTSDHSPAIYTMLTCLNGYFHWLYNPSIAEVLLNVPNKGAVLTWASTGKTTPDVQQNMATHFYANIGAPGGSDRMGDLVREAKTVIVGGTDVRYSWSILGDPLLKVKATPTP